MTNEEAIQIAEERIYTSRYNAETLNNKGLRKINENQAEWLSRIICLAKKQISKPVQNIYSEDVSLTEVAFFGTCPYCGYEVQQTMNYCMECGQALDWSETNDK